MSGRLNFGWRFLVTASCFLLFGLGGIVFSMLVFPPMLLMLRCRRLRGSYAKDWIQRFFALLVRVLELCGVMRLETNGIKRLADYGNPLVLANHPTYIDVVVLLSLMPTASCVVKRAMWRNPFFGGIVRAANYISNSSAESLVDDCSAALGEGQPLVIFPEGTRSRPNQPLKFLRGAAYIALRSGAPILPVILHCDPPILTKDMKWYQIPEQPFRYRVEVLEALPVEALLEETSEAPGIAARKLTEALEKLFTRELQTYASATS